MLACPTSQTRSFHSILSLLTLVRLQEKLALMLEQPARAALGDDISQPRIGIGVFAPFGWAGVSLGWRTHAIIVNNRPWERTWVNRGAYVHPSTTSRPQVVGPRTEHHELREYHAPARPEGRKEERRDR